MSNIQIFNFDKSYQVRTALKGDEPYFCLADVSAILALQNRPVSTFNLDPKGVAKLSTPTKGGVQQITFISEPNLYRVIFRSNKAEAVKFQNWVFDEVLPTIRKTGSYRQKPTNALTNKQQVALAHLVHLCKMKFFKSESASHAIWHRLRRVSGVPSGQPFTTEHLPILGRELSEIFTACEQYTAAVHLAEQTFIRQVLKCDDKDITAKLLADIAQSCEYHHSQKQKTLPAFFADSLADLT
ncbi:Uncharacterized phage-encoded protein [Moraxella ovis]|uniref:Uncharacterized phage-encoded protein n=1 Tax=Moraxella ovis TaxID=29433 RepID=A0A378PIN1_9GAMM|nr:BRO family protein [Moraxella ovis]SPX85374.1 Uncharacterized phage-encoded protein [Moraxella ovis]STY86278.1 Uncharacterized phage-encoded protein [Moraxella ovis]STZ06323.1 Uncharacterized phage-encoded protein [Moraxella ovis]